MCVTAMSLLREAVAELLFAGSQPRQAIAELLSAGFCVASI